MSTLRTDTLQTPDSLFTIPVSQIASSVQLANNSNPALGAALIGYNGGTVASALAGVGNIAADLANTIDIAKGAALVGYKGRQLSARLAEVVSILDFIPGAEHAAILNNTTTYDAAANIQSALDTGKRVYFPNGTYRFSTTLLFKADGYGIIGENMANTKLVYTGTGGDAIRSNTNTTVTKLFCTIENIKLSSSVAAAGILINWKSMQFGTIRKVWLLGQAILGNTLLNLDAVWLTTECTYNTISECYMGLTANCLSIGDGANNNLIMASRFQPTLANGIGIVMSATAAGRISNNNVIGCGFEFPGAINTGINILQNCNGIFLRGNRFEQLLNGIVVGAVGNRQIVGVNRVDNHFDSCTTPINLSTGARCANHGLIAAGQFSTAGSVTEIGNSFNLVGTRTAVGRYTYAFTEGNLPDATSVPIVQATTPVVIVSPSTTGFTVICQSAAGVDTDSANMFVSVFYNK